MTDGPGTDGPAGNGPGRGRRRRPLAALLLGLGLALGALGLAELALRAAGRPGGGDAGFVFLDDGSSARYAAHPERVFALLPHYRGDEGRTGRFATGAWPFRGRVPDPRPSGAPRIAFLGDSCVYGFALDVRDSLPERVRTELVERGWDPARFQVLNLGVPAYSAPQIQRLLAEALETYAPDALVLYPAAWNDQSPALGPDDLEVLGGGPTAEDGAEEGGAAEGGPLAESALADALRALRREPVASRDEVVRAWRAGEEVRPRVSEADLARTLEQLFALAAEAEVPALALVPAHPAAARAALPRLERDARAVESAARAAGLDVIDVGEVLAGTGAEEEALFIDRVHWTAAGTRALGQAVADWAEERLPVPGPGPPSERAPLVVEGVRPTEVSVFGDVEVEVVLGGWSRDEPLPSVSLGGTPLLELRATGESSVAGVAIADGPGAVRVCAVTADGRSACAGGVARRSPRIVAERLEAGVLDAGAEPRVWLVSRPGDRGFVHAGPPRVPGGRSAPGALGLRLPGARVAGFAVAGPSGRGRVEWEGPPPRGGWLQAAVVPRGAPLDSDEKRWSELAPLRPAAGD